MRQVGFQQKGMGMINLRMMFCFLFIATGGCTPSYHSQGTPPQPESVTYIRFKVADDGTAGLNENIIGHIEKNVTHYLSQAGYPLALDYPHGNEQISHVLEARIGKIKKQETPTGFSLSIGNSNPRAMDFQKARVLPIRCTLRSRRNPEEKISLFMDFLTKGTITTREGSDERKIDQYSNHIATVCFNLLEHLRVSKRSTDSVVEHDPWLPEIRIEETPSSNYDKKPKTRPSASENSNAADSASTKSKTTKKTNPSLPKTNTQKRMIIENQGQPIILDFGYERK